MAVAAGFGAGIPQVALILLILGGVSAIGNGADDNVRVFLVAIVLTVGSAALKAVPGVGDQLAAMFTNIGIAAFGASAVGVVLGLYRRTLADWSAKAATAA